jgi:hypothetical protein
VGLSIEIPDDSHLVLYPYGHREPNPFNVSAALRESLTEEELPENLLRGAQELVIDDRPGDVTMFAGSSMWHKRRNAAGAVNLYLKFNDFGSDPLGEDPDTDRLRQATLTALRDGDLSRLLLLPARRLDVITRQLTREPRVEILQAEVWGAGPVRLSEDDVALLRSLDGRRTVGQVVDAAASAGRAAEAVEADVRHLAERGVVDLVGS